MGLTKKHRVFVAVVDGNQGSHVHVVVEVEVVDIDVVDVGSSRIEPDGRRWVTVDLKRRTRRRWGGSLGTLTSISS